MQRRQFLIVIASAAVAASPVLAEDVVLSIVRQLRRQGFRTVTTERTLLGRVRILANRKDGEREIILNPRNGEILRDLWTAAAGSKSTAKIISDGKGSDKPGSDDHGSHEGGGGKDDDDDDADD